MNWFSMNSKNCCMLLGAAIAAGLLVTPTKADIVRTYHKEKTFSAAQPINCYGRSIPKDIESMDGKTRIMPMLIGGGGEPLYQFDWYAPDLHIFCPGGREAEVDLSLVRQGRLPLGSEANHDEMALEFFHEGNLVARYSTLDLAGSPTNVLPSVSHYKVIEKVLGFGPENTFTILTVDKRKMVFDRRTGERLN